MAEKRMFAKSVIDSDLFIDMPTSTRLLYYDLGMRADDDGFVDSPKKIMKITGATQDDLNILVLKNFIIPFESGIIVIKHWKINNSIQKDRYHPTKYINEKNSLVTSENKEYLRCIQNGYIEESTENQEETKLCIQDVSNMDTEIRLDKTRLDKISLDIEEEENTGAREEELEEKLEEESRVLKIASEEFINVTPMIYEMLLDYEKEYGEEIVILAIKECVKYDARTMAYLEAILRNWKGKSLEEIKKLLDDFENKKRKGVDPSTGKEIAMIPSWMNEKIIAEDDGIEITDEERKEFGIT